MALDSKYNHQSIESKYYDGWLKKGYFTAGDKTKTPYTIVIPPPNVTGKLHLGHAWDNTLQDILARYQRLLGNDVLYLPGMDHAGIATQAKVDARLKEMGISRYDIGREKFLEHAWSWKDEYATTIHEQWKKLGLSLDYSRERFTLDEGLNHAVNEVFVKLYEQGLIFRGKRIINWDPQAQTALSNIEVFHKEIEGNFYTFKYQIEGSDKVLEVATTRPETMFGDVCIVVHPDDERYKEYVGLTAINPANHKPLPIITDDYIDIEFGTGVMKCTPAHDPNDFVIGQKYGLEMPICMNPDGTMNDLAGEYNRLDRFECRKLLVERIQSEGNLVEIKPHIHEVGHSERTDVIVEPYLSEQWFVSMKPLADEVLKYQNSDEKINFYPERFEKVFTGWLENIEDWTISRQLWWGHRIPAWYHKETGEVYVGLTPPEDIENYNQDEDVLDTWFSSALWPFSTLGWPDDLAGDFSRYYPTDVMVTGYDIILFWVVRMAFQGRKFTDQNPFKDVLIHGLIRAEDGRKMSKSYGNGVDPMDVIQEYGVDALRFFLVTNSTPGQDLRYSPTKVEAAWNFINKIYNSSRFVLMYLPETFTLDDVDYSNLSEIDNWILTKLNVTLLEVERLMSIYEFAQVGSVVQNFIWDDFCNWYIELSKSQLQSNNQEILIATYSTLLTVLMAIVKMIHPFMPFVSEEIYLSLPHNKESINLEQWPTQVQHLDASKNSQVENLIEIIEEVRKTRVDYNLKPSLELTGLYISTNNEINMLDASMKAMLRKMVKLELVDLLDSETLVVPLKSGQLELLKSELIDKEQELLKLNKQKSQLEAEIKRSNGMLSNPNFINKAAADKVEAEREKLGNYQHQLVVVLEALKKLAD